MHSFLLATNATNSVGIFSSSVSRVLARWVFQVASDMWQLRHRLHSSFHRHAMQAQSEPGVTRHLQNSAVEADDALLLIDCIV